MQKQEKWKNKHEIEVRESWKEMKEEDKNLEKKQEQGGHSVESLLIFYGFKGSENNPSLHS